MYSKDRNNLKKQVTKAGGTTSKYDGNVQFLKGVTIKHGTGNVTTFDGKPCYGACSARDTVKKKSN